MVTAVLNKSGNSEQLQCYKYLAGVLLMRSKDKMDEEIITNIQGLLQCIKNCENIQFSHEKYLSKIDALQRRILSL